MQNNKLRFPDFVLLVISLVIGLGIFSTPAKVAATCSSEKMFFGIWILGGIMALIGSLVYAELGTLVPESGAYYKIFAKAYHPSVGFAVNVMIFFCNGASLAIVALIGAEYCANLLDLPTTSSLFNIFFSITCITLFLFVNLLGLRTSSTTLNFLLVLKLTLMIILISTLFHSSPKQQEIIPITQPGLPDWKLFLVSLIPVCFTYGGYQQTINFGSELKSERFMRRGIILGVIIVIIFYLLLNQAYVHVLQFGGLQKADAIGSRLFSLWFGQWGAKAFDFLVVFSVMAYTHVLLMSNPLVMRAMAEDDLLPKPFAHRHARTGAHVTGLLAFYCIAFIIICIGKQVDSIMGFTMFLDSVGMVLSVGSLFAIAKKFPRKNSSGIYFALAALFMIFYSFVVIGVFLKDQQAAFIALGLFAIVWMLWYFFFRKNKAQA